MWIAIHGNQHAGKDTIGKLIVQHYHFKRIAFAEPVYDSVYALNPWISLAKGERLQTLVERVGWDKAKENPEVRRLLQAMGGEVGREVIDRDLWVNHAIQRCRPYAIRQHCWVWVLDIVVTDLRHWNEAVAMRDHGGLTVEVVRDGCERQGSHTSEWDLKGWEFDYQIVNNGTLDQLDIKVQAMMNHFGRPRV